jgi:predicted Zn-dependent protease
MKRKKAIEQLEVAIVEYKLGNKRNALNILRENLENAGTSEAYLRRYGGMLIASHQWCEGCCILEKASCYSSAPTLQFDLAFAYLKLGKPKKTMEQLVIVQNMIPSNKKAKELIQVTKSLVSSTNKTNN